MSKKKRDLTADEKSLWGRVAATVKPRRKADAKAAPPPPLAKVREKPQPTRQTVGPERTSRPMLASSAPSNRGAEKNVRRGKVEVGGKLDLHGHTQESAHAALIRFLQASHTRGDRAVIVITGVGRAGQGVLKSRLPGWLESREIRPFIAGFAQAHRTHGGAGAFYVFLKRRAATHD